MRPRRLLSAALAFLVLPLAGTLAGSPAWADPGQTRAEAALARVEALFEGEPSGVAGKDPTLVLRDLLHSMRDLGARDRDRARTLLARPTDSGNDEGLPGKYDPGATTSHLCATNVCVHWTTDAPDAPPDAGNAAPAQVLATAEVFNESWATLVGETGAGYRAPLDDSTSTNHGPDGRLDVYLADIGSLGYFGYCASDDPAAYSGRRQVSAYCVVDDDFAYQQFNAEPLESLRVTAAHEFFHTVQFAYDYWEDLWFMEGTAAWAEELVYDDIDDNRRYLPSSQLAKPWLPLDRVRDRQRYGSWLFWQFLTEAFPTLTGPDPGVVREVWEQAAGRTRALTALRATTAARGVGFTDVFATFGRANLTPGAFYEEGSSWGLSAPVTRSLTLTRSRPERTVGDATLDHLTTAYYRFTADPSLTGVRRLKVVVDMPDRVRGSAATLLVHYPDGRLVTRALSLDASGAGAGRVPFGSSTVRAVYVVLTNAGTHNDQRTRLAARAVR